MTDAAGIIGCGLIGRKRALALEAQGVPVLAVFDVEQHAGQELAELLRSRPEVVASAQDLVRVDGINLVVVATTHAALVPNALEAVDAGLSVLVEKPAGRRLEEVVELAERASQRQVVLRVGFNHRFHPALLRAKALVEGGSYGRVMTIRARYGHGGRIGYEREWRADRERSGGGELLDQGIHLIDLTRFLVGEVELVFVELRTDFWDVQVEDNAFLALRSDAGAFAWLHASWTEWKNLFSFEVALERAKIDVQGLGGSYGVERLTLHEMRASLGPPDTTIWEWPRPDESWAAEITDFLGAVHEEPSMGATVNDAVAALRIVKEAYRR